jgi:hypothetical protein
MIVNECIGNSRQGWNATAQDSRNAHVSTHEDSSRNGWSGAEVNSVGEIRSLQTGCADYRKTRSSDMNVEKSEVLTRGKHASARAGGREARAWREADPSCQSRWERH